MFLCKYNEKVAYVRKSDTQSDELKTKLYIYNIYVYVYIYI